MAVLELDDGSVATIDTAWNGVGEEFSICGTRGAATYTEGANLVMWSALGPFAGRVISYDGAPTTAVDGPSGELRRSRIVPHRWTMPPTRSTSIACSSRRCTMAVRPLFLWPRGCTTCKSLPQFTNRHAAAAPSRWRPCREDRPLPARTVVKKSFAKGPSQRIFLDRLTGVMASFRFFRFAIVTVVAVIGAPLPIFCAPAVAATSESRAKTPYLYHFDGRGTVRFDLADRIKLPQFWWPRTLLSYPVASTARRWRRRICNSANFPRGPRWPSSFRRCKWMAGIALRHGQFFCRLAFRRAALLRAERQARKRRLAARAVDPAGATDG